MQRHAKSVTDKIDTLMANVNFLPNHLKIASKILHALNILQKSDRKTCALMGYLYENPEYQMFEIGNPWRNEKKGGFARRTFVLTASGFRVLHEGELQSGERNTKVIKLNILHINSFLKTNYAGMDIHAPLKCILDCIKGFHKEAITVERFMKDASKHMEYDYLTPRGASANCLDIASRIEKLLLDNGERPILKTIIATKKHDLIECIDMPDTLYPQKYNGNVRWGRHAICVSNEKVYDPMMGENPIPLEQYPELAFPNHAVKIMSLR